MQNFTTCFRCEGKGYIYQYEGDLGTQSQCPGCFGNGSISNLYFQCIKCLGKGNIYEYEDELGGKLICPICKNKGYTTERYKECHICKGSGKIYPFQSEKLGVPKECKPCKGLGFIAEREYQNVNFNQLQIRENSQKNEGYLFNSPTQGQEPPRENTITKSLIDNGDLGYNQNEMRPRAYSKKDKVNGEEYQNFGNDVENKLHPTNTMVESYSNRSDSYKT